MILETPKKIIVTQAISSAGRDDPFGKGFVRIFLAQGQGFIKNKKRRTTDFSHYYP